MEVLFRGLAFTSDSFPNSVGTFKGRVLCFRDFVLGFFFIEGVSTLRGVESSLSGAPQEGQMVSLVPIWLPHL